MQINRRDFSVQVTVTTDGWVSRATDSYVTVTAVLVVDWQMVNYVLQTRPMPESHTGIYKYIIISLSLSLSHSHSLFLSFSFCVCVSSSSDPPLSLSVCVYIFLNIVNCC